MASTLIILWLTCYLWDMGLIKLWLQMRAVTIYIINELRVILKFYDLGISGNWFHGQFEKLWEYGLHWGCWWLSISHGLSAAMACDSTNDSHFIAWPWIRIHLQERKMSDIAVEILLQFQVLKKNKNLLDFLAC